MDRKRVIVFSGARGYISALLTATLCCGSAMAQSLANAPAVGVTSPAAADMSAATSQPAPGNSGQVQDIVVTAQKRSERLSDVPISVTAASGEQLARQGIKNPGDLERIVPGFTFTDTAYGAPIYTLRGIGFYVEAIGVSPTVSVYVDQVPLPYSKMTEGASLDLERVEVLKGPQGTLFGQNSTGGAINYIAAKPTSDFHAGAEATYGRFNEVDLSGYVSGAVADTVTARLAVRHESRDAWQHNYVPTGEDEPQRKNGRRDFNAARLLVDWVPVEKLAIELNLNGWQDHSDSQAKQKIAYAEILPGGFPGSVKYPNLQAMLQAYPNAPHDALAAGFDTDRSFRRNDKFYQASLRADLEVSPSATLTSISSYAHLGVSDPTDNDGTIYNNPYLRVFGYVEDFSQEIRLAGSALDDKRLKWLIGGNYSSDKSKDRQFLDVNGSDTGTTIRFQTLELRNDQKVHTAAAFGNVEYQVIDGVTAQAAARYTSRRNSFVGCLADSGLPNGVGPAIAALSGLLSGMPAVIPPGGCASLDANNRPTTVYDHLNEHNVSYRAGLSWKSSPDLLLYANVTKGYKGGAFDTLPALKAAQLAPVPQESVVAYEAGFKSFLADRHVQFDGAIFYYDYRHKQIAAYIDTGIPFGNLSALISVPKSVIKGAELSAIIRPVTGLTMNVGGTYVYSRVKSHYVTSTPFGGEEDIKGQSFPNTPRWQLTSDAEYEFPLSGRLSAFLGGGANYHSRTVSAFSGGPLFVIDSYALLDLRAGIQHPEGLWRLEFWGRNVTNKYYWTSTHHIEDTITRLTGAPATYGVTLRWKM